MLNGTDYYLVAPSFDLLAGLLTTVQNGFITLAYPNIIGPKMGIPAVAAYTDASGVNWPATPAVGDPTQWYVAIRITDGSTITLPAGVTEDDTNGPLVLGVWA